MLTKKNFILKSFCFIFILILTEVQSKDLICQIIETNNYICERHTVNTADGYQLTLHRIPPKQHNKLRSNETTLATNSRKPFLLFHGLLGSAADFILSGRMRSLGCILHEQGYDVWLGNARGTTYSKRHQNIDSSNSTFWDFTWHEIGYYDLSAIVDYILHSTGQQQLHYVGHSQGTTIFFVLLSERPEYNKHIASAALLAPVAYLANLKSPPMRIMALKSRKIEALLNHLGLYELFPSTALNQLGGHLLCGRDVPTQNFCILATFFSVGFSTYQVDRELFPRIFETTPAGISRKQFLHFGQLVNSGKFRQFDYESRNENLRHYNRNTPPEYKLQNIRVPLQLFIGDRDFLVSRVDVNQLMQRITHAPYVLHEIRGFNHIDLLYTREAAQLVYKRILAETKKHYS